MISMYWVQVPEEKNPFWVVVETEDWQDPVEVREVFPTATVIAASGHKCLEFDLAVSHPDKYTAPITHEGLKVVNLLN
jgi:hypothetical protein